MSPRTASEYALQEPPLLAVDDPVGTAVQRVLDSGLPALPVVDADGRFKGIFGEREFLAAVFPGYLKELRGTKYLRRALDDALEIRDEARTEPVGRHMTTDHVDVGTDFSDVQVAELFLHHRVLVLPVIADGKVDGVITRHAFFRAVAGQFVR
jgi:CBS domain-containing protein